MQKQVSNKPLTFVNWICMLHLGIVFCNRLCNLHFANDFVYNLSQVTFYIYKPIVFCNRIRILQVVYAYRRRIVYDVIIKQTKKFPLDCMWYL